MVEKAGHKGAMHKARMGWIEEGKPRDATSFGEEDDGVREEEVPREPSRIAPIFEQAKRTGSGSGDRERQKTPDVVDLFGDEDIYDATPKARKAAPGGGEADEDDLDALMAEAESAPVNSIFGGGGKPASSLFGGPVTAAAAANEPDGDDLDALLAEAEEQAPTKTTPAVSSIFGDGKPKQPAESREEDDLDALMAEVEADGAPSQPVPAKADAPKLPEGDGGPKDSFTDEEEAMAEMEGLW
jgi:replication fork protection complex subunit Csm3/Swi3